MATWETVKQYLKTNYTCETFGDDGLKLTFTLDEGRSQIILVDWAGEDADHATWVDFHSPIGELGTFNLARAVQRTRDFVVGGISSIGDVATLRASIPMENLDRNEIEQPLHLLLSIADQLEQELTGGDAF